MLSDETAEKLTEYIVDLIEELNIEIIKSVGNTINKLGTIRPTEVHKIVQLLQYGDDYYKIINKISEITGIGEQKINELFIQVAKEDQLWAKTYYDFRGIEFIPYAQNKALQKQVASFTKTTTKLYKQFLKSGFMVIDNKNVPITKIYNHVLEKSLLSITSGKTTFQEDMRKMMKTMSSSGIRTRFNVNDKVVDYKSGYSRRLDSSVRMHILDNVRDMSNNIQEQIGKEFDADGVEISVHENPAPDHKNIQGHQFSKQEYEKLQNGLTAMDYNNRRLSLDHDYNGSYRPISTMNCYHHVFSIILGVSKPSYSQKQLDKINIKNEKGFEFEGKHYTLYQGTQLQRKIETKIRSLKDEHIGLISLGDEQSLFEAGIIQGKIRTLNAKYKMLSESSGLPMRKNRLSVSGYKRISTK